MYSTYICISFLQMFYENKLNDSLVMANARTLSKQLYIDEYKCEIAKTISLSYDNNVTPSSEIRLNERIAISTVTLCVLTLSCISALFYYL